MKKDKKEKITEEEKEEVKTEPKKEKKQNKKEVKEVSQEVPKEKHKRSKVATVILWIFVVLFTIVLLCSCGAWSYYMYNTYMTHRENCYKEMEIIKSQNDSAFKEVNMEEEYLNSMTYEEIKNLAVDKEKLVSGTTIKMYYNGEEVTEDSGMLFNVVGESRLIIKLRKSYNYQLIKSYREDIESTNIIVFNVKDTIFPKITGVSNKTITVGDKIDLTSGVSASDEKEGEIEVVVEGSVDTSKAGTYTVKYNATDINGNKTTSEMKVTVKAKTTTTKKSSSSSSTKKSSSSSSSKKSSSSSSSSKPSASTKSGRLSIAKTEAKKVAKQIFKSGMTDMQKAEAIATWLYTNVDPQHEQGTEEYKKNFGNEAYAAFVLRKAACSGFCKAAMLLCTEGKLTCKHINANKWTHQWLQVKIDGKWLELDGQLGMVGNLY